MLKKTALKTLRSRFSTHQNKLLSTVNRKTNPGQNFKMPFNYVSSCYDSKHPPPKRLSMRQGDQEISLYARNGEFEQSLQHAARALGKGLADGRKGNYMIRDR